MKSTTLIFLVLVFSTIPYFAQTNKKKNSTKTKNISAKGIRLDNKYPTVYISFDHFGETEPYFNAESRQGVWLKLHNNTKWRIFVTPTFSVDKDEVGLCYEVKRENENVDTKTPFGYGQGLHGNCSMILPVNSGKYVLFSVPREHLAENLSVFIEVIYSWEDYQLSDNSPSRPRFFAVFNSSDLPK